MTTPSPRFLPLALALLAAAWAFPAETAAQPAEYQIRGRVLDATTQQPLSNVTVRLSGMERAVGTRDDGTYEIRASVDPGTYTLEFRLIGRKPASRQVTLGSQATVQVEPVYMEETALELEELVVTGTGAPTERRAVGNTIATISGEEINDAPGAGGITEALQGKLNGAWISVNNGQAGGGTSVRLRGTSSILGGAEPLFVIDGVIVDNSSTALVSLSANATRGNASLTNRLSDLVVGDIERIEVLKGAAAAALYGSRANNGVVQIFTKQGTAGGPKVNVRTSVSVSETPERYDLLEYPFAGLADVIWGGASGVGAEVERYDLQDRLWRTGVGTDTKVDVSGGDPQGTTYFVGASYGHQDGIIQANSHETRSVRARVGQTISEDLHLEVSGNYLDSRSDFVPTGEQTEGTLTVAIFTPTSWDFRFDENQGRYPYSPVLGANPLDVVNNWQAPEDVTRMVGSVQTTWTPLDRLTVTYNGGIDDYRRVARYFQPPQATSPSFTGSVQNPVQFSRQVNHDITANYEEPLTDALTLSSTGGFRYTSDREEFVRAAAQDLPPGQDLVSGATQFASQSITEFRTVGGFLQERLSFRDRLYLTVGLNGEASSAFGEDQRFQLFPRASVSWLLHEEPWFDTDGLLSSLRLRAAYGETGGQPPGLYSRFNNYVDVSHAGRPGLVASSTAGNPDLKPERQKEWEGGFEAGFFNDRAVLEFTYYHQVTEDLVLGVPQPPSRGVQTRFENIGELENHGVEVGISTLNVDQPSISWRSRLSLSANQNEVTNLVTEGDTLQFGYLNVVAEGEPVGVFYGAYYERDDSGEIVIDPETGLGQRARDENGNLLRKVIGDPNPDLIASLSNQIRVGDHLNVSVLLDGRFGNDVANFTRRITEFFGVDAVVRREIERAMAREDDPSLQPIQYTLNADRIGNYEEYVEDGTFVKLREVTVRYDFGQDVARMFGARGLSLSLSGRNLVTWTDYSGLDPEINLFQSNTVARGVDFAEVPVPRTFVMSVGVNF